MDYPDSVITGPDGSLSTNQQPVQCELCQGNKFVECSCTEGFGLENAYVDCPECGGCGNTFCTNCNNHFTT